MRRASARDRLVRAAAAVGAAWMLAAAPLAGPAGASERGLLAPIVRASADAVTTMQPPARETVGDILGRWGSSANASIYDFNLWLYDGWNRFAPGVPRSPATAAIGSASANLLLNWINEPLSVAGYAFSGRFEQAGVSGRRFLINTFRGWGGLQDRATEMGVVVPRVDFGLAMCAHGMPPGPYTMIPVVGPRTLRDAFGDLVITNVLLYIALIPVIGVAPPVGLVVLINVGDEVVNLAVARQIDSIPTEDVAERGFDRVRTEYLAERDERCGQLRAMR